MILYKNSRNTIDKTIEGNHNNALNRSLIAQSVERRTVNPQVPGSSPGRGAKELNTIKDMIV